MLTSYCDKMAIVGVLFLFGGCVQCEPATSIGFANPYYLVRWLPNAHVLPMQNENICWSCVYRSRDASRNWSIDHWDLYGLLSLCSEEISQDLKCMDIGIDSQECSLQCLNEIYARATALPLSVAFSSSMYRCFFMTFSGKIRICTMTQKEFDVVYKDIFTKECR